MCVIMLERDRNRTGFISTVCFFVYLLVLVCLHFFRGGGGVGGFLHAC